MTKEKPLDLREILIDAHAHFFFLKGEKASRLKLWQITDDAIIVDVPVAAPMRKKILGYIPTLDGSTVYEIEGTINAEDHPDNMPNTIRIEIDPANITKLNRRLYPRINFTPPIEAAITSEKMKEPQSGKITNFSAGGLRVETLKALSAKDIYSFEFKIETEDEVHELKLDGKIMYEIPIAQGFVYGVKFGKNKKEKFGNNKASVQELDRTVDLLELVNKLLIRGVY